MTQQYILGEFSSLLAELQPAPGELFAGAVDDLRREVEGSPQAQLPWLAQEALTLANMICWDALERGDTISFRRHVDTAMALREFTVAASLLP